jgi:hypothetical protein
MAKKELADMKAKILVPTKKTAAQLATDRNTVTMNASLVVSLREQVTQLGAEKYELEKQLQEVWKRTMYPGWAMWL